MLGWNKSWKRLFAILVGLLMLTGFAQMPIFKRYYIADLPGLGWTADFYFNHRFHYVLATILILMIFFQIGRVIASGSLRYVTWFGWIKVVLWAGIIITGILRVLKNFPDFYFNPKMVMYIDWLHLAFPFILGLVALWGKFFKKKYLICPYED
ncbi:MAG: hypothetical protein Q9M37_05145 [Desulfonauticus sp.]|nr:hypothetical protein [Desulfonauticus sp.]